MQATTFNGTAQPQAPNDHHFYGVTPNPVSFGIPSASGGMQYVVSPHGIPGAMPDLPRGEVLPQAMRDDVKASIWMVYEMAAADIRKSNVTPVTRLAFLMSQRSVSWQLINNAWGALRFDISRILIPRASEDYEVVARELRPQVSCAIPEFFEGFVPFGLAVANESLSCVSFCGYVLQGELVFPHADPELALFPAGQVPAAQSRGEAPDELKEAGPVCSSTTTTTTEAGRSVRSTGHQYLDTLQRIADKLEKEGKFKDAAFTALMNAKMTFRPPALRNQFGCKVIDFSSRLVEAVDAGLALRDGLLKDVLLSVVKRLASFRRSGNRPAQGKAKGKRITGTPQPEEKENPVNLHLLRCLRGHSRLRELLVKDPSAADVLQRSLGVFGKIQILGQLAAGEEILREEEIEFIFQTRFLPRESALCIIRAARDACAPKPPPQQAAGDGAFSAAVPGMKAWLEDAPFDGDGQFF